MLTEPLRGSVFPGMTGRELAAMVGQQIHQPSDVRKLKDGQALGLGLAVGFDVLVDHAPGHSRGSVTLGWSGQSPDAVTRRISLALRTN
jgi:glyoxylase-like metal-dependent hydrolase (beta-lactamase superfamily II)